MTVGLLRVKQCKYVYWYGQLFVVVQKKTIQSAYMMQVDTIHGSLVDLHVTATLSTHACDRSIHGTHHQERHYLSITGQRYKQGM